MNEGSPSTLGVQSFHPLTICSSIHPRLCDNGAGGSRLVLPGRGEDADGLVVAGKTVNSGLDQNQAELGVAVLAVALKVLADSNSLARVSKYPASEFQSSARKTKVDLQYLLDQHVKVLREIGSEAYKDHSVSLNRTEAFECFLLLYMDFAT